MNQQILKRLAQKRINPDGGAPREDEPGWDYKKQGNRSKKRRKPGFKDWQNLNFPNSSGGNRHL